METDAKLGLLAGVATVLVAAVVYFNKPQPATAGEQASLPAAAARPAVPPASVGLPARPTRPVPAGWDD